MKGESLAWWMGVAVAGILFAGSGSNLRAQQHDISPVRVQAVDETQTANWPAGPWQSVPRQDYLELLRDIAIQRSRPRSAWIQTAKYSARIDGPRLRDGRLSLQLVNTSPGPAVIPLTPLGLSIESLEQSGATPTWGTTADGTVVLIAPPGQSTVSGRWSLAGREVVSLIEFAATLAPAVQSSLVLDLPISHRLTTSAGQAVPLADDPARKIPAGHRRMEVNLGRRTRCQLVVERAAPSSRSAPTRLLLRQRSICEIAVNGARIVSELVFERTGQPTRDLILSMPKSVRVESILYDGETVDARPVTSRPEQAWRITLPDPLPHAQDGPSRILQVTIDSDIQPGRAWQLPRISVPGTQTVGSLPGTVQPDLTLSIREPLELKTFRTVGWRQTADAVGGRSFTFSCIAATNSLELVIGQPQRSLAADVLARIDRTQAGWTASTEIAWSATSGSSFSTRALLAPGWNIVDLRAADPTVRVEWRAVAVKGNRQQLIVEWPDAVDTATPRPLLIQLSRTGNNLGVEDLPVIEPLDCDRHRLVLVSSVPLDDTRLGDSAHEHLEPVLPEALGEPWQSFTSFQAMTESAAGGCFRWSPASTTVPVNPSRPVEPTLTPPQSPSEPEPLPPVVESGGETVPAPSGADDTGRPASMLVLSRLAPINAELDHHAARITFAGGTFRRPFRFHLPSRSHLETVLVNDQAAGTESDGQWISIPPLEQGVLRTIEIRYTTPAKTGFLIYSRTIPFPRIQGDVTFAWQIEALTDQLVTTPGGNSATTGPFPSGHWTARWFGPLGRGPHQAIFNPLAPSNWRQLVTRTHADWNPSEADAWRSSLATAPTTLTVTLVRHDRLTALGWLVFVLTLIVGGCCRVSNRQPAATWTAGALAGLVLLGWWTPVPWTLLSGAALAACWLLLLFPTSLWRRRSIEDLPTELANLDDNQLTSLESTRTYRGLRSGLSLLVAVTGLSHAVAQNTSSPLAEPAQPGRINRPNVLLPVDSNGRPSRLAPFAFVRPKLLESLKAERRADHTTEGVLLRQATYNGTIQQDGSMRLQATFEAVVTGRDASVRVAVPIDGVNLGPDACRVNGQRYPLARDNDGSNLLLTLKPANSDTPRIDTIEIDLRPTVQPIARGGRVDLAIPSILAGRLELELPTSPPEITVSSAVKVESTPEHYLLGDNRRLRITWSTSPAAGQTRPRTTTSVAPRGLVVIHPLESRLDLRLPIKVRNGELSFITLGLPGALVLRPEDITAPDLRTVRSLPGRSGYQRLVVEFDKPQTKDFEIQVRGRLPLTANNNQLTIRPEITLSHGNPPIAVSSAPLKMGINPASGFQLAMSGPLPEGATAIDTAEFTKNWRSDKEATQPIASMALSLERPVDLPLNIQPLKPRRVVRIEQFLHVRQDRMEMTITMNVRTTGASVFHHFMTIDSRLKITSIGIKQQDNAERLARSSRIGNQLVMFLKDANLSEDDNQAGTQNITIQGELPLAVPQRLVLPRVIFEDAETTSRTLSLYHTPQLSVAVIGAQRLTSSDDATPIVDTREVLAGRFELPDDRQRVELSVDRKILPTPVQMLYHLSPNPNGPWQLRMSVTPLPGPRPQGPLSVTIGPALLASNGTENPIQWQPSPDTDSIKDNQLEAEFQNVSTMTLDAILPDAPNAERWNPPLPVTSGRQIRQRFLVLPNRIGWTPGGDVTQLKSWPNNVPQDESATGLNSTLWRIDGPNWSLARNDRQAMDKKAASRSNIAVRQDTRPATPSGPTSAWWIVWQAVLSISLTALIAWGLPRAWQSGPKEWIRRHDPIAWLVIGLGWWLAGVAGAIGFGLAIAMAAVLLRNRLHRQTTVTPQISTDSSG